MKIAVIGSNGRVGKLIVKEALDRGMDVTAIARKENQSAAKKFLAKDVFSLTKEDLKGFDALVDALGAWSLEKMTLIPQGAIYLADLVKGTKTRLVVVGGAGSLYTNKEHTSTLDLAPDFPAGYQPVCKAHALALTLLRATEDVDWTYISPAGDFQAEGERTGKYLLGGEELLLNSRNESIISYADYALALVDELEKGHHIKERISFVRA